MAKKRADTINSATNRPNDELQAYLQAVEKLQYGDIFSLSNSAFEALKGVVASRDPNHPALERANLRLKNFEDENNLKTNDARVYVENAKALDEIGNKISYEQMLDENEDIKGFVNQVDIVETFEKDGKLETRALSAKEKNEHLALLWKAAFEEAKLSRYGDKVFAKRSKESKKKAMQKDVSDVFASKLVMSRIGSAFEKPTKAERKVGSDEFYAYTKRQGAIAREAMKMPEIGTRIQINSNQILASVADTSAKVDTYFNVLHRKANRLGGDARVALNGVATGIKSNWQKVEKIANAISQNRYEIFRNLKKNFNDNKVQTISNLAATGALTLTAAISAPAIPVALGAYGAYMAASSWVHPIITEARKIKRERDEQNLEPLSFKERWKLAKQNKLSKTIVNENGEEVENRERKKYIRRAAITSGIAIASFGALSTAAAKANKAANAVDMTRTALKDSGLIRIVAPIVAQANDEVFAEVRLSKAKKLEQNSLAAQKELLEAQGEAKQARIGLIAGVGLALGVRAGSQLISNALQNSGVMEEMSKALESVRGSDWPDLGRPDLPAARDSVVGPVVLTETNPDLEVEISAAAIEPMETDMELFPREYSQDLGITQKQYNILMSRLPGIMKDFDDVSLDRAYLNMNDEFIANFEGKTKMEVFYDLMALARNSRRSQLVLGNAESGFYINTPTERVAITDEGIIEQAKQALANGDKVYISRLHGREFLKGQFENLKLDGMTDEKMSQIIEISMNTYDSSEVGDATQQIRALFPDMDKAQISKVSQIVNYNRRFEANGKTLEDLFTAVGCGEKLKDGKAANDLIDNAQAILRQSKGPARIVGQNVECNDTVVHIIGGKKVVQTIVDEPYTKTTKAMKVNISEPKAEVDVKLDKTKDIPPLPDRQGARHGIINNQKQIYDGTAKLDGKGRFIQEDATGTSIAKKLENER
ncbi:MAG: hypothetical protein IJS26_05120 [Alphaproteobacteria bacterium]|nr:hypothetical protein [Alphaproteobacteria bacterium]